MKKWEYEVLPTPIPLDEIKADWNELVLEPSFKESLESSIITPIKKGKPPAEYSFILFGPPGTGKTTVPHAMATSLKWEFFYISPKNFFLKNGSVEYAITTCFQEIKDYVEKKNQIKKVNGKKQITKPANCIFVFDEIDEMVIVREDGVDRQGRLATTMMLPLFNDLRELAKFSTFIFFALTNHIRRFDPAIKRKGRFDLILPVGPPNRTARYLSFEKNIKKIQYANRQDGLVIPDFGYNKYDEKIKTVNLNLISFASEKLGFGDMDNICTRVFEQHKLLDGGLESFLKNKDENPDVPDYTLRSLDTSKFLTWINRQRNSNKDVQSEIDRYYEEYAIYSRGSSPNSELNQIQDKASREFDSLNIIDNITDPELFWEVDDKDQPKMKFRELIEKKPIWKIRSNNKLQFKFRNLAETNTFDGNIKIFLNGAGFKNKEMVNYPIRVGAGESYMNHVPSFHFTCPKCGFNINNKKINDELLIKPTQKGILEITYVVDGSFILEGINSMKGKLASLDGSVTKISRVKIK